MQSFFAPGRRLRSGLALLGLLGACPAHAQPLASDCGGDAFSSARVIEGRAPRRGPLTAVPETLCADLAPQHPPADIRIEAYPVVTPQVGSGGGSVPYGAGPSRAPRP